MSRRPHPAATLVASLALVLAVTLAAGAQPLRLGGEFQVNSATLTSQSAPAIAARPGGDFVVTWYSYHGGSDTDVFARRFSSAGAPASADFLVNSYTTGFEFSPSVAFDAGGGFVIAWESRDQDGDNDGNFAQRFASAGSPLGAEFQVTTYTVGHQDEPAVAVASSGDFVVVWHSEQDGSGYGVFAQRFASNGALVGAEFQINTYTTGDQHDAAVAKDAAGDFVVAWQSDGAQDGDGPGVFARRFTSAGVAMTGELQVNAYTIDAQLSPAVAAGASGDFVVAWRSDGQDGSGPGVFARRFSSAGAALGNELPVNQWTTGAQINPAVAIEEKGAIVVVWQSLDQDGSDNGIFARELTSAGGALGPEFQINSYTSSSQYNPAVAAAGDRGFVIVWQSDQDGSGWGVFAQRFSGAIPLDVDGNGVAEPLSDGLLVLRFLFGFRGATLITGAVDLAGCSRCDAPAIEAYLATQTQ